jgi:hypothetical protein
VKSHFTEFLNSNKLLSKLQFGFKKSHSTADALLSIIRYIAYALNSQQKCVMISIDLKKCFDTVDRELMLKKLELYGCDAYSLKWFKSYLIERYNFVVNNKCISDIRSSKLSVPQGGCLSTLLFLVFINDIFKLILYGMLFLFADDLTLVVKAKTYKELEVKANTDLKLIHKWLLTNKLVPNLEKSNFIVMGCPLKSTQITIKLGQHCLKRVNQTKILGVTIDHDLRFNQHIENLSKSISNKVKFMSRLRYFLPEKTLNFIYKALVFPIYDYCDIVWGFTYSCHIEKLIKLQNHASKVITFSDRRESSAPLFNRLKWSPFSSTFNFHTVKYIYRALNDMASENSSEFFKRKSRINRRIAEDELMLDIPRAKYNFLINSIFYNGIKT